MPTKTPRASKKNSKAPAKPRTVRPTPKSPPKTPGFRQMNTGALVMLDALGFKGIWKRESAGDVITKLHRLKAAAVDAVNEHGEAMRDLVATDINVEFLSDTIVLGVSCGSKVPLSLNAASHIAAQLIAHAAVERPAFALRGSVSCGEFLIDGNFIIGPAVDDAAKHMDSAEGAFVWLTPTARREMTDKRAKDTSVLHGYPVPMKGGGSYWTQTIMPFPIGSMLGGQPTLDEIVRGIVGTFTADELSIEIKRQNTEKYLESAKREAETRGIELAATLDAGT